MHHSIQCRKMKGVAYLTGLATATMQVGWEIRKHTTSTMSGQYTWVWLVPIILEITVFRGIFDALEHHNNNKHLAQFQIINCSSINMAVVITIITIINKGAFNLKGTIINYAKYSKMKSSLLDKIHLFEKSILRLYMDYCIYASNLPHISRNFICKLFAILSNLK